LFPQR
jgi:hypothetical protein